MLQGYRFIKVNHWICDEVDSATYLLAPNNKSNEEVENDINIATTNQLAALRKAEATNKVDYNTTLESLSTFPENATIKEAKDLLAQRRAAYDAYHRAREEAGRSFSYWIKALGDYKFLFELEEDKDVPTFTAYWGHNHSLSVNISETVADDITPSPNKPEVRISR